MVMSLSVSVCRLREGFLNLMCSISRMSSDCLFQGCQVGFFEANFLESGFFPRQLASKNVGWLFIEIWLFPGFFVLLNVSIALPCIIELEKSSILQYMEHTIDMELCNV